MLNIVLYCPEIPQNTGNIIRTCVGFNAHLHLIRPYGFIFDINSSDLKRSGVNYLDKSHITEYDSWDDFKKIVTNKDKIYFLTRYGINKPNSSNMKDDGNNIYIVFGKESTGIDKNILKDNVENTLRIPTSKDVRSLNVANCVSILAYEFAKQNDFKGLEASEPHKPLFGTKI